MSLTISTGMRNAMADAMFNAGAQGLLDNMILEVRSGTRPASANDAPVGTVGASITLPADAVGAAAAGAVSKAGTWQDGSCDATITATWFRIRAAGDAGTTNTTDKRIDGDVAASGSPDLLLDNVSLAITQVLTITAGSFTVPAS